MRAAPRVRLALAFAGGLAACPVIFFALHLHAEGPGVRPHGPATRPPRPSEILATTALQFGGLGVGGGGGGAAEEQREPARVVYLVPPVTGKSAKAWETLQKPITLALKHETPLEDFLAEVKKLTRGADEKPLQIFVDPVGLQEAEKTFTSPVTIALEDVPAATILKLALAQIGLKFSVTDDGIVFVTNENDEKSVTDPSARILNELSGIREELADLKKHARSHSPQPDVLARQFADLRTQIDSLRSELRGRRPEREANPGTTRKGAGAGAGSSQ